MSPGQRGMDVDVASAPAVIRVLELSGCQFLAPQWWVLFFLDVLSLSGASPGLAAGARGWMVSSRGNPVWH